MSRFEERNPRLWAALERLSALVLGSLLFLLLSAPLMALGMLLGVENPVVLLVLGAITLPAALVGLFSAIAPLVRPAVGEPFTRFWQGYRQTFRRALIVGLIDLVLGIVLWVDIRFFLTLGTTVGQVAAYVFGSLAILAVMINAYVWPLLAWYPQPLKSLLKRAFLLTAAHPFWALSGLAGFLGVPAALMLLPPFLGGLLLAVGPGAGAAALGWAAWQGMKRYTDPDDDLSE